MWIESAAAARSELSSKVRSRASAHGLEQSDLTLQPLPEHPLNHHRHGVLTHTTAAPTRSSRLSKPRRHTAQNATSPRPSQCLRQQHLTPTTFHHHASTEHLPRIAQPSFWQSLIPRALRDRRRTTSPSTPTRKPWNPATIFIILPLLVGSGAIQLLVLRTEMTNFSRKADAHIALLREVIERGGYVVEEEGAGEEKGAEEAAAAKENEMQEEVVAREKGMEEGIGKERETKAVVEGTGEKRGPVGFY
ncbi:hypothetical protein H2199_004083 [Coniosporium tulheliwenetii]|uniref:Uncharacterized protein n=1 Tax=Coniosporium tulheliwenetii TaxID=3383036 RepID=A0ACC2Z7W6_9PEZI|nr:hypothetical protein H2199_004083 [Cladosporium sp. JES 115]